MEQTRFSLSETKSIQEDARRKYADGRYSFADYLATILNNPLKFTSANRSRVIVKKENGRVRIAASRQQIRPKNDNQ